MSKVKELRCELDADDGSCMREVRHRNDGHDLCFAHWSAIEYAATELKRAPDSTPEAERAARIAIRDAIHSRDEIVMGRHPNGDLCSCQMCQNEPQWMSR